MVINTRRMLLVCMIPVVFIVSGCATVRHAVPPDLVTKAIIPGMPEVRGYLTLDDSPIQQSLIESLKQEGKDDYPVSPDGVKTYPILAISGGSANGAYGAGLLKGWSKAGTRPMFKVITGVSTGAITAPLAFLGPEYDSQLEELYTSVSTRDVMRQKGPLGALFSDSLASNKPLEKYIRKISSPEILKKIASEHLRGRRLLIGTANLDAQKFVIWDMGAIAARGDEKLFEDVIIASSSIPIAFPPVYFHVEAGGKKYDEMHVDGGTITQVFGLFGASRFLKPAVIKAGIDPSKIKGKSYIIRNGYVSSRYQAVKDTLSAIASRSMDTMIDAQAVGDIYRMFAHANKRGADYNLAYIPADVLPEGKEMFDKRQMRKLFDRGYEDAARGYDWHKAPPGWVEDEKKATDAKDVLEE
jgi:hypothetical protein